MNKYQVLVKESYSYGLNVSVPLSSYVEALNTDVMILGGGDFGKLFSFEKVLMVELS